MEQNEREGKRVNGNLIAVCAAIAVAVCAAVFAWIRYTELAPVYAEAVKPTPTAASGNVMAVTRDPSLPTPLPSLRRGSRGERVAELQRRLAELGYYTGEVDGQFGTATEQAVMLFQRACGLEADGYVGELTQSMLDADDAVPYGGDTAAAAPAETAGAGETSGYVALETSEPLSPAPTFTPAPLASAPAAPTRVLRRGTSGDDVRALQSRLQALGYLSGAVDGQFGPATLNAVKAFQMVSGLSADGEVGPATWTALFSADAQPKPTPIPFASLEIPADRPYVRADGLPLIVNKTVRLPDDYRTRDLVDMASVCDPDIVTIRNPGTLAEREAVEALMVMLQAAAADGVTSWQVNAAYRTLEDQQRILDDKISEEMRTRNFGRDRARQAALNTVAEPGASEHHLGTCFDIAVPNTPQFSGTRQHRWLVEHCWEYGFILRYPEGKERITGYTAEAWHFRWVGQPHANLMHEAGLCLEEYVARYGGD